MSDPFIAQIKLFAGNFAPRGYTFCQGQLLPIAQYTAVFALVGTIYGGDGRTTFGVPDLTDRLPLGFGNGPGLTPRSQGQRFGSADVVLNLPEMPNHNHTVQAADNASNWFWPGGTLLAESTRGNSYGNGNETLMESSSVTNAGGGQAHPNLMPTLPLNYIFALQGVFPSRA